MPASARPTIVARGSCACSIARRRRCSAPTDRCSPPGGSTTRCRAGRRSMRSALARRRAGDTTAVDRAVRPRGGRLGEHAPVPPGRCSSTCSNDCALATGGIARRLPDAARRQHVRLGRQRPRRASRTTPSATIPTTSRSSTSGPAIKLNSNQRYATSARSAAMFQRVFDEAGVPSQVFVSRNNMPVRHRRSDRSPQPASASRPSTSACRSCRCTRPASCAASTTRSRWRSGLRHYFERSSTSQPTRAWAMSNSRCSSAWRSTVNCRAASRCAFGLVALLDGTGIGLPMTTCSLLRADELGTLRHRPLRAADAHRNDRHTGLDRDVGRAVEQRLHDRPDLALALGEQHKRLACLQHGDASLQRFSIGGPAADREAAERRQQPAERLVLPILVGAHEAQPATRHARCDRGVEDAAMGRRQEEDALCGHVLAAFDGHSAPHSAERRDDEPNDLIRDSIHQLVAGELRRDLGH